MTSGQRRWEEVEFGVVAKALKVDNLNVDYPAG